VSRCALREGAAAAAGPECFCASSPARTRQRVLLCHDFRGGYPRCEAAADGVAANLGSDGENDVRGAWRFREWAFVDVFVYFSHGFVSPPPAGFVEAGHRHSCKVLGTVIFEWDRGKQQLLELLRHGEAAAEKIARIASFFGFDGYLLNVECSVTEEDAKRLLSWTALLRSKLCAHISHAELVWYDAVTINGDLRWQNTLTTLNEPFFHACGSIFLNYHWNAPKLRGQVMRRLRNEDRAAAARVFAGVDVFGRGTFGGGGYQSYLGVRAALAADHSVALFAPAWTAESDDAARCDGEAVPVEGRELRFWFGSRLGQRENSIAAYVPQRPTLTHLPLRANFDPGWSSSGTFARGKLVDERAYYNLRRQSLQPCLQTESVSGLGPQHGVYVEQTSELVYDGGAALLMDIPVKSDSQERPEHALVRVFRCDCELRADESLDLAYVSTIVRRQPSQQLGEVDHGILLVLDDPPECVLLLGAEGARDGAEQFDVAIPAICLSRMQCTVLRADFETRVDNSMWFERQFHALHKLFGGRRLVEIMLFCGTLLSFSQNSIPQRTTSDVPRMTWSQFGCALRPRQAAQGCITACDLHAWSVRARETNARTEAPVAGVLGQSRQTQLNDRVFLGLLNIRTEATIAFET